MRLAAIAMLALVGACTSTPAPATAPSSTTTEPTTTTSLPTTTLPPVVVIPDAGDGPIADNPAGEVFDVTDLSRFRSSTGILLSRDQAGLDVIIESTIAASYVREPEAVEATIASRDAVLSIISIGDEFWLNQGEGWDLSPVADQVLGLTSVTALTPDGLESVLAELTDVGIESVGGRPALHYQGGVTDVQTWLGGSPELDQFSELETGSIDVWVDEAGFVSKADYAFGGTRVNSSATEYYRATFELFDFDGDFEITAPG